MICPICSSAMSEPVEALFALPTVTSDCRPWHSGRSVEICSGCGVMHRVTKPDADFESVYDGYKSYPEPEGRTKKVLEFVKDKMPTPQSVLDMGCGQGDGIAVLQGVFPQSVVTGYEPSFGERPNAKFDLITLFHVLEHVEDLHEMLGYIKSSLTDNGHVLIQVPYTVMWPFDLILADHWWHFNKVSLDALLNKNGFEIVYIGNDPITKEITLLAYPTMRDSKEIIMEDKFEDRQSIDWLLSYKKHLDTINERVVVYGTGPAAAWVGSILGDKVEYYIDDDFNRIGTFNGKQVFEPMTTYDVVAPFPDWQLSAIKAKHPNLRFL